MATLPDEVWSYEDLKKVFRRTFMTLYLWRKYDGFPSVVLSPRRVVFLKDDVLLWAKVHGKQCYLDDTQQPRQLTRVPLSSFDGASSNAD